MNGDKLSFAQVKQRLRSHGTARRRQVTLTMTRRLPLDGGYKARRVIASDDDVDDIEEEDEEDDDEDDDDEDDDDDENEEEDDEGDDGEDAPIETAPRLPPLVVGSLGARPKPPTAWKSRSTAATRTCRASSGHVRAFKGSSLAARSASSAAEPKAP